MSKPKQMLQIVAYQPEIALNLGTIVRTCACLDLALHVVEPCGFPFSVKALKRSAMDYADIADISHHNDWDHFKKGFNGRKVLLTTKATQSYTDFEYRKDDALILGRESAGVPQSVVDDCDEHITIPMPGGGRSLNVATSMAMVAGEALRQLRNSQS